MKFYRLTSDNFLMYAIRNYENPSCTGSKDFNKDLRTLVYIKKFLNKMRKQGIDAVNPQLLVNHIITLVNLFQPYPTSRILFAYFEEAHWPSIVSVLEYLNIMPEKIPEIESLDDIIEDPILSAKLDEL